MRGRHAKRLGGPRSPRLPADWDGRATVIGPAAANSRAGAQLARAFAASNLRSAATVKKVAVSGTTSVTSWEMIPIHLMVLAICWESAWTVNHGIPLHNGYLAHLKVDAAISITNKHFTTNSFHAVFLDVGGIFSSEMATGLLKHIFGIGKVPVFNIQQDFVKSFSLDAIRVTDNTEDSVGYIFFANRASKKCLLSENYTRTNFWNPRALILIITEEFLGTFDELTRMLRDCWETFNILNLVVVFTYEAPATSLQGDVFSASYNPFLDKLSVHGSSELLGESSETELYPCKICDTHGYIFNVTHSLNHTLCFVAEDSDGRVHFRGPDGAVLDAVVKSLGGSVRVVEPLASIHASDRIHSKTMHANEMFVMSLQMSKLAYPSGFACFTAVVPKAEQKPRYLNFLMPFRTTTWLFYLATAVSLAATWKITTRYDTDAATTGVALESVRLLVWGVVQFKPRFFVQRLFLIAALVFNFMFSNLYQGSLTSYLTTPHFYRDIDTFEELARSDLAVSIALSPEDVASVAADFDDDSEVAERLVAKMVFDVTDEQAFAMCADFRNMSRIVDRYVGQYVATHVQYFKDGQPTLHVMEDCFINLPYGYMTVTRDNPFLGRLSTAVGRLLEAGLVGKWRKDHAEQSKRQTARVVAGHVPTAITMEHMYAVLLMLCLGELLAVLVFVAETAWQRAETFHFPNNK